MRLLASLVILFAALVGPVSADQHIDLNAPIEYGPRPAYLISQMADSPLKTKLQSCAGQTPKRTLFSIGHRGAPVMFPEHTVQSNVAAARMGAGILECDVTFTADLELVCRHAQADLHKTTNIMTSDLAGKCLSPSASPTGKTKDGCYTTDLTLAEFRELSPNMDAANRSAAAQMVYSGRGDTWLSDVMTSEATLLSHSDSIALFRALGAKFTPELKAPDVKMPFNGFTQEDYAQKLVDAYKGAGVPASDVWMQSFNYNDVLYWIENEPEFGAQAVYLDAQYRNNAFDPMDPNTWARSMAQFKADGVNYLAPPMWMLVTLKDGEIVPSTYAKQARAAGLQLITWTLERSGPLNRGGGWYFQSVADAISNDGDYYEILDVLAQDVQITGIFSDWPATATYYANCMGL